MFCKNCGHQLSDTAQFCKNCGANLTSSTEQSETAQVEQSTQRSNEPPPPVYGNSVNIETESIPPSFKSSKDTLKKWLLVAGVVVIGIIIGVLTNTGSNEKKFSALSEQEQETLMTKLYERLDQYFISDLQIDEQLAQLLVYEDETMSYFFDNINQEALEKEGQEIGLKVGRELMEVAEKWATDNNIDFEDWTNNIDGKALAADYMAHLIQIAQEEANATMQEMKETIGKDEVFVFTLEKYRKIKTGMSYEEVINIIGFEIDPVSEGGEEGTMFHTLSYSYYGDIVRGEDAVVGLVFVGGILAGKTQEGLE
jgi:hypothetical protein